MGNLKIDTINETNVDSGFMHIYEVETEKDICSTCDGKNGRFRFFNSNGNLPRDIKPSDNDLLIESYSIDSNFHKIIAYNVRGYEVYEISKNNGQWEDWKSIQNADEVDEKLSVKVDKNGTKQLSDENFTKNYKVAVDNLVNTNYFRGYFDTIALVRAIPSPKNGWYCICLETKTIWYYNNEWKDLENNNTSDMHSQIYDPLNVKSDCFERSNHHGLQNIDSISNLQKELDNKLNKSDKTKVVDNFSSNSGIDALSANCGKSLQSGLIGVLSGLTPIEYGSLKNDNGYTTLSNGIILQWGSRDMGVGRDNVTLETSFNIPYPNKCFVIMTTPISSTTSGSGGDFSSAMVIDRSKFYLVKDYASTSNSTSVSWFSIGY